MGRRHPHLLALLAALLLVAFAAAGCGGDRSNLIPQQRAQALNDELDAIQQQIDAGQCDNIETKVETFHDDATSLTSPVDKRLRTRINQGVKSLQKNALATCQDAARRKADEQAQTETQTQTTDTTTTETDTTPTQTDTTPTTSTPTTSEPTGTTPPTSGTPPDTGGGTEGPTDTTPGSTGDGISGGNGGASDGGTG